MEKLDEQIKNCQACPLYKEGQAVIGEGQCKKSVVIIGEAPGKNESETGKPFQGRSGKILDGALAEAGFKRDDFFITNVVKHRPPDNRNPSEEEIEACHSFLEKQMAKLNPDIIVTLGKISSQAILGTKDSIRKMRGQYYTAWIGEKWRLVMPSYHPAACLYDWRHQIKLEKDFIELKNLIL